MRLGFLEDRTVRPSIFSGVQPDGRAPDSTSGLTMGECMKRMWKGAAAALALSFVCSAPAAAYEAFSGPLGLTVQR